MAGITPQLLDDALLQRWPLPVSCDAGGRGERGRLLIVGGSPEIPGAIVLAATAALRAGAGGLTIATVASMARALALTLPEARVIALPETSAGGFAPEGVLLLAPLKDGVDAVLIGPGMQDEDACCAFVRELLPHFVGASIVLDALAMSVARVRDHGLGSAFGQRVALTPHAAELAHLTGLRKKDVVARPLQMAGCWSLRWNAVLALKGRATYIASPDASLLKHEGGGIGLSSSGCDDALAGIIIGLAARGATLQQACAWGVYLHARAGERLAQRFGPLGYLARELAAEIPRLLHELGRTPRAA